MIDNLTCQYFQHNSQEIVAICIKEDCNFNRLCCFSCLQQHHKDHIQQCLNLSELISKFDLKQKKFIKMKDEIKGYLQQIQQTIQLLMKWVTQYDLQIQELKQNIQEQNLFGISKQIGFINNWFWSPEIEKMNSQSENQIQEVMTELQQVVKLEQRIVFIDNKYKYHSSITISELKKNQKEFLNISQDQYLISLKNKNDGNIADLRHGACFLFNSKDYFKAVETYDLIINRDPQCIEALYYKGISLCNLMQFQQAIECFNKTISLKFTHINAHFGKGLALTKLFQYYEAVQCFDQVLQFDEQNQDAYIAKAQILEMMKQYQLSIECYEQGLQILPNHKKYSLFINKGDVLRERFYKYNEAIQCFDQAITISPNQFQAYQQKGVTLVRQHKEKEAIQFFEQAINLSPEITDNYCNKGFALKSLGLNNQAIHSFDKAIEIDRQCILAYQAKGDILGSLKQYKEAIKCQDEILSIDPNYFIAYYNKGFFLKKIGQLQQAIRQFDLSIQYNSTFYDAYNQKGWALVELQQFTKAKLCFDLGEYYKDQMQINQQQVNTGVLLNNNNGQINNSNSSSNLKLDNQTLMEIGQIISQMQF